MIPYVLTIIDRCRYRSEHGVTSVLYKLRFLDNTLSLTELTRYCQTTQKQQQQQHEQQHQDDTLTDPTTENLNGLTQGREG